MDVGARGWAVAGLVGAMVSVGCGHRLVSALGNPGDYCTIPESCPEGSECQETEDGFRCVLEEDDGRAGWGREGDNESGEDPSGENPGVEEDSDLDEEDDGDDGEGESESDDGEDRAEGEDDEEYEPPSRRRRRRR